MKTFTKITLALALSLLFIFSEVNAKELMPMSEESYIDDIPFNTETIFDQIMDCRLIENCCMEDEKYIDDIPFDTKEVVTNIELMVFPEFNMDEESTIDDLPAWIE